MTYRKARGLCFKCGAKWGPQHKCAATVPLHLVEEVWQMLAEPVPISTTTTESDDDDDELMALSEHALKGTCAAHALKFAASIYNFQSVILVDPGSSHNFISEQLASQLTPWTPLAHPMTVKVADGATLKCTHEVVNCSWSLQGTLFATTFKILPLHYWEWSGLSFSPVQIEWKQKWLSFVQQGQQIQLQGIQENVF